MRKGMIPQRALFLECIWCTFTEALARIKAVFAFGGYLNAIGIITLYIGFYLAGQSIYAELIFIALLIGILFHLKDTWHRLVQESNELDQILISHAKGFLVTVVKSHGIDDTYKNLINNIFLRCDKYKKDCYYFVSFSEGDRQALYRFLLFIIDLAQSKTYTDINLKKCCILNYLKSNSYLQNLNLHYYLEDLLKIDEASVKHSEVFQTSRTFINAQDEQQQLLDRYNAKNLTFSSLCALPGRSN